MDDSQRSFWKITHPGGLRIRESASTDSSHVGTLLHHQIVECTQRQGDWIKHRQGWSLIRMRNHMFMKEIETPSSTWSVVWRHGVRVRPTPDKLHEHTSVLDWKAQIIGVQEGNWVGHDHGWSMIGDDGKVFLQRVESEVLQSEEKQSNLASDLSSTSPSSELTLASVSDSPPASSTSPLVSASSESSRLSLSSPPLSPSSPSSPSADPLSSYKQVLIALTLEGSISDKQIKYLTQLRNDSGIGDLQHQEIVNALQLQHILEHPTRKTDNNERKFNRECVVCLDAEATQIILMCMHACLCDKCAQATRLRKISTCPNCRSPITDIKKMF